MTSELRGILGAVSQDHCATRIASLAEEHATRRFLRFKGKLLEHTEDKTYYTGI